MKFIDAEFWMAGDGDITEDLVHLVKELDLGHKVKFLGKLDPSELKSITLQAYIGINFLENLGLNNYYSLANKTFDYIQAGIPAIHMNFPEYKVINDEFNIGLLIPDLNKDSIVTAVNKLINDDEFYEKIVQNTKKAAVQLNWERESKKLIKIYKSI